MSALPFEYNASWERLVSDILSPPVVWALLAFPLAFRSADNAQQALTWALTYITLVCVLPIVYIALMVKRGSITDIHMPVRNQRIRPFLVSILCTMFAWGILRLMGAPAVMPLLALFSMVQLAIMLIITFTWQISIHAISISGATIALGAVFGMLPALIIAPLVVLVGAARVNLNRHTPAQVIVGSVVGFIVPALLFVVVATV
jgi:membrane-associated phospholipid phosphatase